MTDAEIREPEVEGPVGGRAIAKKATRGTLAVAHQYGLIQLIQLASTLVIARLVAPADYGVVAIALTAVGFARYVGDLGVSTSFLSLRKLDDATFQTGALVAGTWALLETLLLEAFAPALAALLHDPANGVTIIRLLSLCILFEAPRFGPTVRLSRNLEFARLGTLGISDTVILYAVQLAILLAGGGEWALVAGPLARSSVGTLVWVWNGGGLVLPARRTSLRALVVRAFPFQGPAILAALYGFLFPMALTLVLDANSIGFWAWATVLATPVNALVLIMSQVTLPTLARLRDVDPDLVERASAMMLRASLLLPAAGAGVLLGLSHPLVHLLFGRKWGPALPAVELNLVGVVPATFSYFLAAVLESDQRARERFVSSLVGATIGVPVGLVLAYLDGATGAAFASALLIPTIDSAILGWMAKLNVTRACVGSVCAFVVPAVLCWSMSSLATSLPRLVIVGVVSVVPLALGVSLPDRKAVRTVFRYGVSPNGRVARAFSRFGGVLAGGTGL